MGPLVQVAARVHTTPQMYVRMCICVLQARCRCLERKAPMPKCESIPVAPEFIPSACEFIRKAPKCPQRGRFENDESVEESNPLESDIRRLSKVNSTVSVSSSSDTSSTSNTSGCGVDVRGYVVDVRAYGVDVRGYVVDVRGYGVDVRGYGVNVGGYDGGVEGYGADVWGYDGGVKGYGVDVRGYVVDVRGYDGSVSSPSSGPLSPPAGGRSV
eukprot:235615-Pyramimonas_sp.AAC.1